MSASDSSGYILELGEYNLIIARTNLSQRPRAIDDLREVWLGDAAAVDAALNEVKSAGDTPKAIALFRLKPRAAFVPDAAQAKKVNSAGAVEDFLRENLGPESLPANWSWCTTKDGRPPENGAPWLLDAVPAVSGEEAVGKLRGWSFDLLRCESASLALIGALSSAARTAGGSVLLFDIAETKTFVYAISAQGVNGFTSAPVGFDSLAEATQGALGLKFRGSAARLLFNESYDFSDSAAKIVEPLVNGIKTALPNLGSSAPTQVVCTGILAKQAWIANALVSALGLKAFSFDVGAWSTTQGLSFTGNAKADGLSPSWLGVLGAAAAYDPRNPGAALPWNPILTGTPVAAAPIIPAIAPEPPPPKPAVVVTPPTPKPADIPAIKPEAAPAKAAIPPPPAKAAEPAPAKPAVVITPPPAKAAEPAKGAPAPAAKVTPPAKPADPKAAAKPAEPAKPATPAVKPAPTPTTAQKVPGKPEPAKPAPAPIKPAPAPAVAKPATVAPFPPAKKNNLPLIIAVVAALILGGGGFFWYSSKQKAEEQAIAKAKADAESRAAQEAAARRAAEEKAVAEEAARKKAEQDAAQKAIAAEQARIKAEEETRKSTTERLLSARGTLELATDPVGATVVVGELAPRPSPVKLDNLRLGHYSVTVTLAGYDTEQRDIEIKENETADLGTIKLHRQTGSLEITSDPAGLPYELKPAGVLFVNPSDVRTGKTPETINDLPVGSYSVSIAKPGWPSFTSAVTVDRGSTARVQGGFVGGGVTITSTPSGATVMRDNQTLGNTPLTLNDLTPGNVTFTVVDKGYDPTPVSGKVESGKTITLNATLLDSDRVMKNGELDERPTPISEVEPELTASMRAEGGSATVSCTIGKDGVPTDLRVTQQSNPALGRACLSAVAKWRFKPGSIRGKPVRSTVTVPFRIQPQT